MGLNVGLMWQNENGLKSKIITIQWLIKDYFQPLLAARVSLPFHLHAKEHFGKNKV